MNPPWRIVGLIVAITGATSLLGQFGHWMIASDLSFAGGLLVAHLLDRRHKR